MVLMMLLMPDADSKYAMEMVRVVVEECRLRNDLLEKVIVMTIEEDFLHGIFSILNKRVRCDLVIAILAIFYRTLNGLVLIPVDM